MALKEGGGDSAGDKRKEEQRKGRGKTMKGKGEGRRRLMSS